MPHADSAWLPKEIVTKVAFWEHVHGQLQSLVIGQRSWVRMSVGLIANKFKYAHALAQVTNLANASSLLYNALLAFNPHFGHDEKMVNWCGKSFACVSEPN
jgi:L-methionine (R)-S-oxide reductase